MHEIISAGLIKHQRFPEWILAKLVANFRRSLEGDFRASFAGENHQKHFPPKLHRKLHHQTSLRGSGLWRALINCVMISERRVNLDPQNGPRETRFWIRVLDSSRREFKGQQNRANRTQSFWEGNLPVRGSLRGPLRGRVLRGFSEVFRGFQRFSRFLEDFHRFSEILRGFQRFVRGFQRSSQRPSERQISLSEALSPASPYRVAPWTFSNLASRC